jgi:hypothetical protein
VGSAAMAARRRATRRQALARATQA